jgi:hypothetical protein
MIARRLRKAYRYTFRLLTSLLLVSLLLTSLLVVAVGVTAKSSTTVTPDQWLKAQPKPFFRSGHTLPRLSRYGWNGHVSVETRVELAENWGYALGLGQEIEPQLVSRLDNPASDEARIAAKAKSDPKRYPLEVIVSYRMPGKEAPPETWVRNANGKALDYFGKPLNCNPCSVADGAVFSPEAPDKVWQMAGEYRAGPLRTLVARGLPISIVLDGGERGLGVYSWAQNCWPLDPRIRAAKVASGLSWQEYSSRRKAHAEQIIANAIRAAAPRLGLYNYFGGDEGPMRNSWLLTPPYVMDGSGLWHWKYMRTFINFPPNTIYYLMYNTGFTGRMDVLTQVTNAVGLQIPMGDRFSYNWINAGAPETGKDSATTIADFKRWTGFLKCWYMTGMIGSVFCYWHYPAVGFNASFPANNPPPWLRQMAISGHVHALFSHLEGFVRASDLLPGPMRHSVSKNDPAYEFPTGDATARVLARKHRVNSEWLLAAWAAAGGDRTVQVNIPELGRVSLQARSCGSVYRAKRSGGKVTLSRIDEEGCTFTHAPTA